MYYFLLNILLSRPDFQISIRISMLIWKSRSESNNNFIYSITKNKLAIYVPNNYAKKNTIKK